MSDLYLKRRWCFFLSICVCVLVCVWFFGPIILFSHKRPTIKELWQKCYLHLWLVTKKVVIRTDSVNGLNFICNPILHDCPTSSFSPTKKKGMLILKKNQNMHGKLYQTPSKTESFLVPCSDSFSLPIVLILI